MRLILKQWLNWNQSTQEYNTLTRNNLLEIAIGYKSWIPIWFLSNWLLAKLTFFIFCFFNFFFWLAIKEEFLIENKSVTMNWVEMATQQINTESDWGWQHVQYWQKRLKRWVLIEKSQVFYAWRRSRRCILSQNLLWVCFQCLC